jgi:two-component system phosphate regulon response regulator PhoB
MTARVILVIEDDLAIRRGMAAALRHAGYEVREAGDGVAGAELALVGDLDLVLLDLVLPRRDGLEVLRRIRSAEPALPVIVVTARGAEGERVRGLEMGADDYVVKPFSVRELLLRVQAVLRRSQPAPAAAAVPLPTPAISFGRLRIDRDAPNVQVDDQDVSLTALELRLLCTLYERRNRVQSRAVLLDDVWCVSGENATRTVDTHVKRLREKLGPAGAYIETIRGIGYRFIGAPPKQPP